MLSKTTLLMDHGYIIRETSGLLVPIKLLNSAGTFKLNFNPLHSVEKWTVQSHSY